MTQSAIISPSIPEAAQPALGFSRLPTEIREQIWLHTLLPRRIALYQLINYATPPKYSLLPDSDDEGPRTYQISYNATIWDGDDEPQSAPILDLQDYYNESPPPGPVALRVCRESRTIALSRYQLAFGSSTWTKTYGPGDGDQVASVGKPRIWVDFERDEILITLSYIKPLMDPFNMLPFGAEAEVKKIRRLGITRRFTRRYDYAPPDLSTNWGLSVSHSLGRFEALKEFTVLAQSEEPFPANLELDEQWRAKSEKEIFGELDRAKRTQHDPKWTIELPVVKVILSSYSR